MKKHVSEVEREEYDQYMKDIKTGIVQASHINAFNHGYLIIATKTAAYAVKSGFAISKPNTFYIVRIEGYKFCSLRKSLKLDAFEGQYFKNMNLRDYNLILAMVEDGLDGMTIDEATFGQVTYAET